MKLKSIVALILVLLICLPFAVGCRKTSDEESKDTTSQTVTDNIDTSVVATIALDTQLDPDADLFENKKDVFNILLLGVDDINDLGITDTIMLLSVSKAEKRLKLTSIMEDTVVNIPGYRVDKLSMAYALGGAQLMVDTVRQNFSVDVHRYALVNYFTFEDTVDILGGVELELTAEDVSYINDLLQVNGESGFIEEAEGKINLTGKQALCYVRNCGGEVNGNVYSGDDFTRGEKQRVFMQAVAKKLSQADATQIRQLAGTILPILNSDLTMEEMQLFVANIYTYLDYTVETSAVPFEDGWSYVDDTDSRIEVKNWIETQNKLKNFIYGN
ncbi:MAG: LCP family protein [Ruminococcus sp.]|nr:LCP family protein [Ruminococcus sp.]